MYFSGIKNRMVLLGMRLLSGKLPKKLVQEQYASNREAWKNLRKLAEEGGYLEHQSRLSSMYYGSCGSLGRRLFFGGRKMTARDNSCEVIAVYNTLAFFGEKPEFPDLLKAFSEGGICWSGRFGTSPHALVSYLRDRGYAVEFHVFAASPASWPADMPLPREEAAEEEHKQKKDLPHAKKQPPAFILTAYNRGSRLTSMLHTVSITREGSGYRYHNASDGTLYPDIRDAVQNYHGGKGNPLCLIIISLPKCKK